MSPIHLFALLLLTLSAVVQCSSAETDSLSGNPPFNPPPSALRTKPGVEIGIFKRNYGYGYSKPKCTPRTRKTTISQTTTFTTTTSTTTTTTSTTTTTKSPSPTLFTGVITLRNSNNDFQGYVSKDLNSFGEFIRVLDKSLAVTVNFSVPATASPFLITGIGSQTYPFIGGIEGYSSSSADISPGSANYLYFGGTVETAPSAVPADIQNSFTAFTGIPEKAESAIWYFDDATKQLTPKWINLDGSTAVTIPMIHVSDDVLVMTGDAALFVQSFGSSVQISFFLG